MNYKVDSIKLNDIREKIYGLPKEYIDTFGISLDEDNVADNLQRHNGNFVEGYINEPILKLLFLKEINRPFKPVMKDKTYGNWDIDLLEKIKNHLGAEEAAIPHRNLENTMKLEPDVRNIINEYYRAKLKGDAAHEYLLYKEPMGFGDMDRLLYQVSRYTVEGSKKDIDYYKTKDKLDKVIPKKAYREWLTKLSEGIIEKKGVRNDKDLYTPSGRMRSFEQLNYEYTLDNIIKLMRGDVRGEEGFMYGLGNVRAGMAKEFKSIEDIKQHKDKIVSPEEFREIKEKANQEYYNLSNQFSKYHGYMIGSSDAFNIAMFETAKKGRIVPSVFKAELKEDGYKVNDIPDSMIKKALDFLNSLKDMPTEYFEAKPQRGVGFDEVAAMVVPKTTDKELLQQLKGKNIKVIKYDEKIEGDRLKKVNSVKGVKFSLKDSQGRTLTQEQAEYFKNSTVRDGEGNLLVVYHGTNADFTVFNPKLSRDIGLHFGTKEQAETFGNTQAYYLNAITNDIDYPMADVFSNLELSPQDILNSFWDAGLLNGNQVREISKNTSVTDDKIFKSVQFKDARDLTESQEKRYQAAVKRLFKKIKTSVMENGYTGVVYRNKFEGEGLSYLVFNPEQIKSVDNLEPTYNEDIRYSLRTKEPPKKTIKAYKLLRIDRKTGKLYPLFVGAKEETPIGVWLDADEGEMITDKKTGTKKVKSKLGNLAYRPGWHLGDIPLATHIGVKGDSGKIEFMNPDHVWAEVDVAADINYQEEANRNGTNPKTGKINPRDADIKRIPVDGFYRYKTNPNMAGEWIITGAIKINRVLSDSEVAAIVRKAGYEPLPRKGTDVRYQLKSDEDGVNYLKSAIKNFDFIVKTSDKSKLLERTKNGSIIHINKVDDDGTVIYSTSWGPARTKVSEFIEKINNGEIAEVGLKRGLTKDEILEKIRAEREKALKTFNPKSVEPKKVSISESATYKGQDMEWTETYIGKTVLKAGEKAYHTSYRDISSFYPKETCFYESYKLNVIGGDKNIYCLIPKKDIIVSEYSGDGEIRVDLERYKNDVDIYYIGYGESFSVKDDFDRVVGKFTLHHLAPEESYSTNNRIKYQLRDNKSAKDIERLQNTVARLKEQFKLTKGVKLDEKAVRKLAKAILKDYSSKYSSSELEVKLYNVYMGMVNGTMEYDEAQSIITEVARDIIENVSVLNDAMYKQYSELRNTMRNTAISIDDRYKGDFDAVGGWNDFRKRNFGRMNITNDGMSIDKLYQELSDSYPELFLKDVANPADQLMLISDVLDSLVPIYENPYNRELNEAVEYLALEIFDGMTSVPEAKPTFADRKKAEKQKAVKAERDKSKARVEALKNKNAEDIAWLKYQNKEKLAEVLQKEKAKRDEAVAKVKKQYQDKAYITWWRNKLNENDIKSHYQEMIKELRSRRDEKLEQQKTKYKERISGIYEDRKIRQAKDRIRTMAKKLDKMLRSPTQKQHIPKALDKTIAELLTMLDFTTDRQKETTQIKLRDLRAEYEKIAKVSDEEGLSATADPYIVEALEMLHGKRIVDMNLQEIELLRDIVGYFENMVRTYNKAFLGDKWIDVSTKAEGIIKDLETDTPMNESAYGGILYFKDMMNWGMLTPQMFFERMGNTFNSLYDDFRAALDVKINNTKIAQDYMSNLLANSKDKVKEWTGKKAEIKTIKLDSGKTIELTQAQLMSFYLLMKREQARGHIFGLGIKAAPIVAVDKKGMKYVKKQFEPVKITLDDATRMIAMLSKEQRRIADGIGKFMNTYSKQWVNEATLQNYGYELAKEENYFPIKVDRDFLKSDFDNTNLDPTFTSMGFLKATIKGAGNAIILEDVFDVFTEHADKAATYNAFVGITESTKKIVNYKTQDNSIKQAMNKKFGIQAFNYLKKFMVDLQGGIRTESGSPIVTGLIRNVKRATLGLNLRTIIQQPTAIVRASALIDIDYLIKGIAMKSDKAEMLEKSPIARWKSWGYFNLDTGRSMKDIILDSVPLLDKQYQGMQIADDITWTKIWNAVKLEIEDTEPGLKVGSAEYFDAVNYRFNEIIDRTQVVDTVMHRSDAMRQSDSSWKILTAFMSEPTKSYNLLLNAVEKYNTNKSAENKKVLLRTFSAWTATMLVNTLVISMLDMWRRKEDDKETFKDKWIDNILNDVTGYVPIVRDIYSLFEGYSVKRMEYNGIERIVRAINRSKKYIEEIAEDKKHSYPLRLITKDWIESVAYVFGVGAINVSKDLEALLRNYTRWIDDEGAINEIYEFMFKK